MMPVLRIVGSCSRPMTNVAPALDEVWRAEPVATRTSPANTAATKSQRFLGCIYFPPFSLGRRSRSPPSLLQPRLAGPCGPSSERRFSSAPHDACEDDLL